MRVGREGEGLGVVAELTPVPPAADGNLLVAVRGAAGIAEGKDLHSREHLLEDREFVRVEPVGAKMQFLKVGEVSQRVGGFQVPLLAVEPNALDLREAAKIFIL